MEHFEPMGGKDKCMWDLCGETCQRSLGSSRSRWENNIKMASNEG